MASDTPALHAPAPDCTNSAPTTASAPAAWLVVTTLDNSSQATILARTLVEKRLAACVHMLPTGHSVYRWEDRVETSEEMTLLIKTHSTGYHTLERYLLQHHPYTTPEIIAVPITQGCASYLAWIRQCTG